MGAAGVGSDSAKAAIERAGALLVHTTAVVRVVWRTAEVLLSREGYMSYAPVQGTRDIEQDDDAVRLGDEGE